jgi:hypothetical protein
MLKKLFDDKEQHLYCLMGTKIYKEQLPELEKLCKIEAITIDSSSPSKATFISGILASNSGVGGGGAGSNDRGGCCGIDTKG